MRKIRDDFVMTALSNQKLATSREHTVRIKILLFMAAAALLQGCAVNAPQYSPALDNVESMKKSMSKPTAVGAFVVNAGLQSGSTIALRAVAMTSPVGEDYAAYLAEALRKELTLAGKLDAKSNTEISGALLKNDIAAGGIVSNSGEIEARFVVKVDGLERYQAVKRADATWGSSFLGQVAVPMAQQQYPLLVQKLISQLLADEQFIAALR
jgi:hypothetical protein